MFSVSKENVSAWGKGGKKNAKSVFPFYNAQVEEGQGGLQRLTGTTCVLFVVGLTPGVAGMESLCPAASA